jgi:hypothetical protein
MTNKPIANNQILFMTITYTYTVWGRVGGRAVNKNKIVEINQYFHNSFDSFPKLGNLRTLSEKPRFAQPNVHQP